MPQRNAGERGSASGALCEQALDAKALHGRGKHGNGDNDSEGLGDGLGQQVTLTLASTQCVRPCRSFIDTQIASPTSALPWNGT